MKEIHPTDLRNAAFDRNVLEELIKVHGLEVMFENMRQLRDDLEAQLRVRDDVEWRKRASIVHRAAERTMGYLRRRVGRRDRAENAKRHKHNVAQKEKNRQATASITALDRKWGSFAFELALELHAADPTALAALDGPKSDHEGSSQLTALEWAQKRLAQRQAKGEYLNIKL